MNPSDFLIYLFLFGVGSLCGLIASAVVGVFNHWVINSIFSESLFRNLLSLFLILIFSFLGSMIGFVGILGFAADENAGDIFPYYLSIAFLVAIVCTSGYYFLRLR